MSNLGSLLKWLDCSSTTRGVYFAQGKDEWLFWSYERLAGSVRQIASALLASGLGEGERVAIVMRSGPEFLASLFGTMLAGATASPMAPPLLFQDGDSYSLHLQYLLGLARPSIAIVGEEHLQAVIEIGAGHPTVAILTVAQLLQGACPKRKTPSAPHAMQALLQFTSGSTGNCRAVRIGRSALENNIASIVHWLQWSQSDGFASWLPPFHDMGLVGGIVAPVTVGCDLWLLQPEHFIRSPLRYLQRFDGGKARLSAIPNFGLEHILRRVSRKALEGLDFSRWKALVVGAERVNPASLEGFASLLAPFGFQEHVLLPAYGLAEATLAVSGVQLGERWKVSSESKGASRAAGTDDAEAAIVGCGKPLNGVSISIVDEQNRMVPDATIGEIVVRGPSIADGYADIRDSASASTLLQGELRTGDAGFLLDQELFVVGRFGDSIKVRGRAVFSDDVEAAILARGGLHHRIAVLLGTHDGRPTMVCVIEHFHHADLTQIHSMLQACAPGAVPVVLSVARGTIPRTSSGKPKRRQLWNAFVTGRLSAVPAAKRTSNLQGVHNA